MPTELYLGSTSWPIKGVIQLNFCFVAALPLFVSEATHTVKDEYSRSFWLADKKQLVRFSEDLDLHTKSEPGSRILFSLPF